MQRPRSVCAIVPRDRPVTLHHRSQLNRLPMYRSAPTLPVSIGIDFLIFDSNELIWGQGGWPTHTDYQTLIGINFSSLILKLLRKNRGPNDDMLQTSYREIAS